MLIAKDNTETIHGIAYFVCDYSTIYLLSSGINSKIKGASIIALVWEGVKLAKATGRNFDFEGSMLAHVETFNRAFNGDLKPYLVIKKAKNRWLEGALSFLGRF